MRLRAPRRPVFRLALIALAAVLVALAALAGTTRTAQASAGGTDLLDVVRLGDGTAGLSSAAAAVDIYKINSDGTGGAVFASVPRTGTTALTMSGSAASEGGLQLSADGRYLVIAGYRANTATASVKATATRVLGRIAADGTVDTSTTTTAFATDNIRGAATDDGSRIWTTGSGTASNPGVAVTAFGTSTTTTVNTSPFNTRVARIADNTLYVSTQAAPAGIYQLGTAGTLPTGSVTATQLSLASLTAPNGFEFVRLQSGAGASDTLYVTDGTALRKYSLVSGSWVANGSVTSATAIVSLAVAVTPGSPGQARVYATTTPGSNNKIVKLTDSSGYNATITGTFSDVASAGTNFTFNGIVLAPGGQAGAPAPSVTPAGSVSSTLPGTATTTATVATGDSGYSTANLTLTATSSNTTVLPNAGIAFSGTGATRTLTLTPANAGSATVTLTVTDPDRRVSTASFAYTVSAGAAPTVSVSPATLSTTLGSGTTPSATATVATTNPNYTASQLTLTASSSNTSVVPSANIAITGSGATRTVTVTPAAAGTATITLTATDPGNATGQATIAVTVTSPPPPTITAAATGLTAALGDTANPTLDVTVGSTTYSASQLTVSATSSASAVVPNAGITVSGSGATRILSLSPAGTGLSTITVRVTDPGGQSATTTFTYGVSRSRPTPTTVYLNGASDESSAIDVGNGYFLVGDDEDNSLRLYNTTSSNSPTTVYTFTFPSGWPTGTEFDIEAAARVGNRIWWLGSGSNTSSGNLRNSEWTLYATDVSGSGASTTLSFVGAYMLRPDLIAWDQANGHGLGANALGLAASAAAGQTSKQIDGFAVEGMEFSPDGSTAYVGFRAPLELPGNRTKALVVPVTNMNTLVTSNATAATTGLAQFGTPFLWNLGGLSVREIRRNASNQYLIIAGSYAGGGTFELWTWNGNPASAPVKTNTVLPADTHFTDGGGLTTSGSWEAIQGMPDPITNGSSVSIIADDGSTSLFKDNDGNAAKDYVLALRKSRLDTISIVLPPQTVAFTSTPPATVRPGTPYTVSATGGASGNPVTFSLGAGSGAGVCTVSAGGSVTFLAPGTCQIAADQAGTFQYEPAGTVFQGITVLPLIAQTITFTSTPPATPRVGGSYQAAATGGGSGNPITFFPDASGTPGVCAVSASGAVTFLAPGTCAIAASQPGGGDYLAAPTAVQSFTVLAKLPQFLIYTSTPPSPGRPGIPYTASAASAPGNSGNPITFSLDALSTPGACSVAANGAVVFLAPGTCVVTADQAGDATYDPAPSRRQFIVVDAVLPQTVSITSVPPVPAWETGTYGPLLASGGASGNPVVFSVDPASSGVCALAGSGLSVNLLAAGACTVVATQAGGFGYAPGGDAQTFTVAAIPAGTPDTLLTTVPPVATTSRSVTVAWTASLTGSTFECSFDGGAYAPCSSPRTYNGLSLGTHVLAVRAVKNGLRDPLPAVVTWTIVPYSVAPATTFLLTPGGTTSSRQAPFSWFADQAGATYQCALDGAAFAGCSSPRTYNGLTLGSHTLRVRSIGATGLVEATPASYTWLIVP